MPLVYTGVRLREDIMIKIRELNPSDMNEAIRLKFMCWTEELAGQAANNLSVSKELDFWLTWMKPVDDDVRLLIGAFEDNRMLGVAFASYAEPQDIAKKGIELNGLWVYPEQRNKGISLQLMAYITDFYSELGVKSMVIYNHHYSPSNKYYQKFGVKVIRQDKQMQGKLLIDVFTIDLMKLQSQLHTKLIKYNGDY